MSGRAISLAEWQAAVVWQGVIEAEAAVETARQSGLHPAAAATIHHHLIDMRAAADAHDEREVVRLAGIVRDKLALERQWYG